MKTHARMSIAITSACNQMCEWCFAGDWTRQKPSQFISLDNFKKLIKWRDWSTGRIKVLALYGGEPTLHPQLIEMIDFVREYDPRINIKVYSNLTCKNDLVQEVIARGVQLIPNIDQFENYNNSNNSSNIMKNLDYLNNLPNGHKYDITVTVSYAEKEFDFLYDILEKGIDHIGTLKVAPASPGSQYRNKWTKELNYDVYNKILEVVTHCSEISPNLRFAGGCAANYCLVSDEILAKLGKLGYHLMNECGVFGPNADILADLSCHWCFAFQYNPEMSVKNVLDYTNYDSLIEELIEKKEAFQKKNKLICNEIKCYHPDCVGLCPARNNYQHIQRNGVIT